MKNANNKSLVAKVTVEQTTVKTLKMNRMPTPGVMRAMGLDASMMKALKAIAPATKAITPAKKVIAPAKKAIAPAKKAIAPAKKLSTKKAVQAPAKVVKVKCKRN